MQNKNMEIVTKLSRKIISMPVMDYHYMEYIGLIAKEELQEMKIYERAGALAYGTLEVMRKSGDHALEHRSKLAVSCNISALTFLKKQNKLPKAFVLNMEYLKEGETGEMPNGVWTDIYYNGDYVLHPSLFKCVERLTFFEKIALSMHAAMSDLRLERVLSLIDHEFLTSLCVGVPGLIARDFVYSVYPRFIGTALTKIRNFVIENGLEKQIEVRDDEVVIHQTEVIVGNVVPEVIEAEDIEEVCSFVGGLAPTETHGLGEVVEVVNTIVVTSDREYDLVECMVAAFKEDKDIEKLTVEETVVVIAQELISIYEGKYVPPVFEEAEIFFPHELVQEICLTCPPFKRFKFRLISKQFYNAVAQTNCMNYYYGEWTRMRYQYGDFAVCRKFSGDHVQVINDIGLDIWCYDMLLTALIESFFYVDDEIISSLGCLRGMVRLCKPMVIMLVFAYMMRSSRVRTYRYYYWSELLAKFISRYKKAFKLFVSDFRGRTRVGDSTVVMREYSMFLKFEKIEDEWFMEMEYNRDWSVRLIICYGLQELMTNFHVRGSYI